MLRLMRKPKFRGQSVLRNELLNDGCEYSASYMKTEIFDLPYGVPDVHCDGLFGAEIISGLGKTYWNCLAAY